MNRPLLILAGGLGGSLLAFGMVFGQGEGRISKLALVLAPVGVLLVLASLALSS